MSAYDNTPQSVPQPLIGGVPGYAFGSQALGPVCRMQIVSDSVSSNVVTLTVRIKEGNTPSVGDLIYTYATSNSGGALNQTTGIAIASVSIGADGTGTVTFPKTVGNQGTLADSGYALSKPAEVGEALSVKKSAAFAAPHAYGGGYAISWAYTVTGSPATISIQLEGAVNDNDSEYVAIGTALTTTTGYVTTLATVPENINFVRLNITATTGGTNPKIIGKIMKS